ncbi:MAG: lactate dehydrogenase [Phycisphaera sp.]|nr:lactate dehydrogenase [Phycisphaera sp.]
MSDTQFVMPVDVHNNLVEAAYRKRGYTDDEAKQASRFCELAAWHGIKTHNALKALHLDELFGSQVKPQGCVPGATIDKRDTKFAASEQWNGNFKLGQAVAFEAMDTCMKLADKYGVGQVSVDNAFHYLWGGGYVIDAANKGYIAYTNCTSTLAEVVPFGGKFPTLGTNPHSWAFPTTDAIGFPICIDWATSTVAMGRVQQFKREGKTLPPGSAVDANGKETTDPNQVKALLPFGAHKGYGLSLINELYGGLIGGSLPTLRGKPATKPAGEKTVSNFYFQVIHPDAMNCGGYAKGRTQSDNLKAVIDDILGHGNESCLLPGQIEARSAAASARHNGLLFTAKELDEFKHVADEAGISFDTSSFAAV